MKLKLILLFFTILFPTLLVAEKSDSIQVKITVMDKLSQVRLPKILVEAMTTDSMVMNRDSSSVGKEYRYMSYSYYRKEGTAFVKVPRAGKYLLRLSGERYQQTIVPLTIPEKYKKKKVTDWEENVYIARERGSYLRTLETAVVTATKIKMVHKGDTIVFNADAFELAGGSMLDALLAQLPGMKLSDGGVITYNGKRVKDLLIDGKNFFKEDPKVALENLPAYMVNKVNVYKKEANDAYLMSSVDREKSKELVVDVRLKKQYAQGFISNIEVGGGTFERYLARIFSLRYTNHSRLSVFGTANNLNDTKTPGREGNWNSSAWEPSGTMKLKMAGANFNWEDKNTKAELSSYAEVTDERIEEEEKNSSVNYLINGDTWSRKYDKNDTQRTHFSTRNNFKLPKKDFYWEVNLNMEYMRDVVHGFSRSATFDDTPSSQYDFSALDSAFVLGRKTALRRLLVSRLQQQEYQRYYSFTPSFGSQFRWQEPLFGNSIYVTYYLKYDYNKRALHDQYDLERPKVGEQQFQHRYTVLPSKSYKQSASLFYSLSFLDKHSITLEYSFDQSYNRGHRSFYRLDSLPEWGKAGKHGLRDLPSTIDSLHQSMDIRNSYLLGIWEWKNAGSIRWHSTLSEKLLLYLNLNLSSMRHRAKDYRNALHHQVEKSLMAFNPSVELTYNTKLTETTFQYYGSRSLPTIYFFLPVMDTYDPFSVQLGNENLKNPSNHQFYMSWRKQIPKHQANVYFDTDYTLSHNSIAQSRTYNRQTAVSTYRPENVNGNWAWNTGWGYERSLDSLHYCKIKVYSRLEAQNSVDLVPYNDISIRSTVRSWIYHQLLGLSYNRKGVSLEVKGRMAWVNLLSHRPQFTPIHSLDFSYGVVGNFNLPFDFELSTDLEMFSRRGYYEATMNDDHLIWNLSLARTFLKDKSLRLSVEGYDILRQKKVTHRMFNEQGFSEVWYNAIPRYFLLRLAWKFHKNPKKT